MTDVDRLVTFILREKEREREREGEGDGESSKLDPTDVFGGAIDQLIGSKVAPLTLTLSKRDSRNESSEFH